MIAAKDVKANTSPHSNPEPTPILQGAANGALSDT